MSRSESQTELLQSKYKKALHEITQILKVNDSLKKCLDQAHAEREQQVAQIGLKLAQTQQQAEASHNTIQQLQSALSEEQTQNHQLHLKIDSLNQQKGARKVSVSEEELVKVRSENQLLRSRMAGHSEWRREKEKLNQEIAHLRVRESELVRALSLERQKNRREMCTRETEWMRSREGQSERLRSIESKYQLLQSELSNYRQMQKYWEDQARSMEKQEVMFNNIRQQIERINQDFNRHEMESCNVLLRKRQEDAEKDRHIHQLQAQIGEKQKSIEQLQQRIKHKDQELHEASKSKEKLEQLEESNKLLNERVYVLEALTEAQQHRSGNALSERIRQFQARVQLLVDEEPNPKAAKTYGGLEQVIVLKGYVLQLSEKISQGKRREERLTKKLKRMKGELTEQQKINEQKIEEYKKRIQGYDILVNKLYGMAEEKAREKMPEDLEQEFNTAIAHYEGKMIAMTEEIIALRKDKENLEASGSIQKSSSQPQHELEEIIVQKDELIEQLGQELTQRDLTIEQLREGQGHSNGSNQWQKQLQQKSEQILAYREELAQLYQELRKSKGVKSGQISESNLQMRQQLQTLRSENKALTQQLKSQQSPKMQYYTELQRRASQEDASKVSELHHQIKQLNQDRQEQMQRKTIEVNELNSTIIDLRTNNLALRSELEDKDVVIDQLKHQLFMEELRSQREKSASSSVVRDSFREKTGASDRNRQEQPMSPQHQVYKVHEMQATSERTLGEEAFSSKKGTVHIKKIL